MHNPPVRAEYREEPCRSALNRVSGIDFSWSLNPYMGCAHRCTFCYVRAFERRADRPSDDRYGWSVRVKTNIAEVLRVELARPSWRREEVVVTRVLRESPAARAGLTRGDQLLKIQGKAVKSMAEGEAQSQINANAATGVSLLVRKRDKSEQEINLKEGAIYPMVDEGVAADG